jgi:GT2 family glycosyltransferase
LIDNGSTDGTKAWGERLHGMEMLSGKTLDYIRRDKAESVAKSWNDGVKKAFEDTDCSYVLIVNNDVVLHHKAVSNLIAFMDYTNYLLVTSENIKNRYHSDDTKNVMMMLEQEIKETYTDFDIMPIDGWRAEGPDFSCFMINRDTIEIIGWFDENFVGAYCEDQDYHVRIERAKAWGKQYGEPDHTRCYAKRLTTSIYHHFASQTIIHNPTLRPSISSLHNKNESYYQLKWGASHPDAMDGKGNVTPFGDATKNWKSTGV